MSSNCACAESHWQIPLADCAKFSHTGIFAYPARLWNKGRDNRGSAVYTQGGKMHHEDYLGPDAKSFALMSQSDNRSRVTNVVHPQKIPWTDQSACKDT